MTRAAAVAAYVAGTATLRELGRQAGVSHQRVAQWVREDAPGTDGRRVRGWEPKVAPPPPPPGLTTRQVLEVTGVNASRLDRWRRRYQLGTPRNPGRGRTVRYGPADLASLGVLLALHHAGAPAVTVRNAVLIARTAPRSRWVVATPEWAGVVTTASDVAALVRRSTSAVTTVVDLSHSPLDIDVVTSRMTP